MELFVVIVFTLLVFFFQDIVNHVSKFVAERMKPSSGKIVGLACITACAVMLAGLVSMIPVGFYNQVTIFLISFGLVIFMTLFVLSLLFVATIPEDMEKESEEKDSEGA